MEREYLCQCEKCSAYIRAYDGQELCGIFCHLTRPDHICPIRAVYPSKKDAEKEIDLMSTLDPLEDRLPVMKVTHEKTRFDELELV